MLTKFVILLFYQISNSWQFTKFWQFNPFDDFSFYSDNKIQQVLVSIYFAR